MFGYRKAASFLTMAFVGLTTACTSGSRAETSPDLAFAALQARGEVGMGVDQYVSRHVFDALPDGGRIEYQHDSGDLEGVALIREHLREIQTAFEAGDFSTPAFVHDRKVPGTDVMAARREHIDYRYADLPRGGELRLVTSDPEALEAIRAFMAFQRDDHRAEGMDHGDMDHGTMDHGTLHTGGMDHGGMGRDGTRPRGMGRGGMGGGMGPGAMVVQTSDDPALVEALQAHAAEVTELVDEGMIAMMRGMMEGRMEGMMRGMHEGGPGRPAP